MHVPSRIHSRAGSGKEDGSEASTGRVGGWRSGEAGARSGAGAVEVAEIRQGAEGTAGGRTGSRICLAWDDNAARAHVLRTGKEVPGGGCGSDDYLVVQVRVGDLAHQRLESVMHALRLTRHKLETKGPGFLVDAGCPL